MTPTARTLSILDLIARSEATASATAEHLRAQITTLTDQLTTVETELTELAITRTTLDRLATHTDPAALSDPTLTSPAYQQIIATFTTATTPLRAKDACLALGTQTTPKNIERLRTKLKRLVARQVLTETEPGLFTLATTGE